MSVVVPCSWSPLMSQSGEGSFQHIGLCFVFLYYQEEVYLKEVKLAVEILRSALYRNDECKVSLGVCLLIPHC